MRLISILKNVFNLKGKFISLYLKARIFKYKFLSDSGIVSGKPNLVQPVLYKGMGKIEFNGKVELGVALSPSYYSSYGYMEVRKESSRIIIGDGVYINNNCCIIADGSTISIGDNTLIGAHCEILDSDFHDLNPAKRMSGIPVIKPICIGQNVFIGNGVRILKGVTIGDNSVIASGSIVTKDIQANCIACGVPAKVIKSL